MVLQGPKDNFSAQFLQHQPLCKDEHPRLRFKGLHNSPFYDELQIQVSNCFGQSMSKLLIKTISTILSITFMPP